MNGLPDPTLGVWIPTWDRAHFFHRLVESLEPQVDDRVDVWVGVNPPSHRYDFPDWCTVIYNSQNIGQSRNIRQGITLMGHDYVWVLGDDERVLPGALDVIRACISAEPGIVICQDGQFDVGPTGWFPNWPAWMDACVEAGREVMLTAHTLMATNVFRRAGVDLDVTQEYLDTRYGHHFGMLAGLMWEPVVVTDTPVFRSGRARDSSVWSEDTDYRAQHNEITQAALRHLIHYASNLAGRTYPESCYQPGVGFDT